MTLADTRRAYRDGVLTKPEFIGRMHTLHARLHEYPELLKDGEIQRIEISAEGVVMVFRSGIRMLCGPADKRITPLEALNFGSYERDELKVAERLIPERGLVLDVGANHGWFSLHVARDVPGVRVIAFEPVPATFRSLKQNLSLNGMTSVEIHNLGLADGPGELSFYYCADSSGSASAANIGDRVDAQMLRCPVDTLDHFLQDRGLAVDFIKCDVEGAELLVFRGARETLRTHAPIVLTEMLRKWSARFDYHPNDLIALFRSLGYGCHEIVGTRLRPFPQMDDATMATNFVFLHAERHARLIQEFANGIEAPKESLA